MLSAKIVGLKEVKGTNREGKPYSGVQVSFVYNPLQSDFEGLSVGRLYFSSENMVKKQYSPCIDDNITVSWSRKYKCWFIYFEDTAQK